MARNVFSVPIFFIVFRETLEAAIIISVLLGLVEQIIHQDPSLIPGAVAPTTGAATPEKEVERSPLEKAESSASNSDNAVLASAPVLTSGEEPQVDTKRLLRKMRIYIFSGAFLGLFIALAIGAAFIAVWFTQASDLWAKSEDLWEGTYPDLCGRAAHLADGTSAMQVSSSSSHRSSSSLWVSACSRWTVLRRSGASSCSAPSPVTVSIHSMCEVDGLLTL